MTTELHHGDCLDVLRTMPMQSINAVITDPPYGINYATKKGIKVLNDDKPFIWWLRDAYRITKPNGALLCFCRWDVQEAFRFAIELAGYVVRSQIVWDRRVHGAGDTKRTFAPQHDIVWFATKGRFAFPDRRPKSVLSVRKLMADMVHPTQKPVELMRQLVEAVTENGDTVLDPFMGSGATGIACVETGRHFIGIELDAKHFHIAEERIHSARLQGSSLPAP